MKPARCFRSWMPWLMLALLCGTLAGLGVAHAARSEHARVQVLVALGQLVEVKSRQVDLLLERGDTADALDALEQLRVIAWPSRQDAGDAAVILRHDVYGRLVRLRLEHPSLRPLTPEQLLALVDEGLGADGEGLEPNAFTARLIGTRGEVLETLGRDDDALTAYETALGMNRDLLTALTAEGTP